MSAKAHLSTFANDESGATAIEYGLIAGILSISIVAGLTLVKTELQNTFSSIATAFSSVLN